MTTQEIISRIEDGKWNRKFYGNAIYLNDEKIECNKEELFNALLNSEYAKADKQTRTNVFVSIAKQNEINLPALVKENPDSRIPFDKFANGKGLNYLHDFFNSVKTIEKDFFFNLISQVLLTEHIQDSND